jgi:hypothetical protein
MPDMGQFAAATARRHRPLPGRMVGTIAVLLLAAGPVLAWDVADLNRLRGSNSARRATLPRAI